ncbi:MAG: hypothetical protein WCO42_08155 [bacterium]
MKSQRIPFAAGHRSRIQTPLKPVLSHRKDLIRLNTSSLRKKALQAHHKAEQALSKLKNQLKRYHEQDVPGFRSWVHRTFGHLLTRQRELQQAIEEKRTFIYEIEAMAKRYRLSDLAAYRKVLWRHSHPDEAQEEDRQFEENELKRQQAHARGKQPDNSFDENQELDNIFGDDEFDDIPDGEWGSFNDFFETMTGIRLAKHDSNRPHPDQKSVKELYRSIVRLLHPDHHGQMTDVRKALWHEAQEAYRRHDLNALHSILARCDAGEAGLGDHSPVSLIRRLTQQLRTAAQTTRHEMRDMRRDVAWDYETRINNPNFVRSVKVDLEDMVSSLLWNLNEIERELARLDRLASRQGKHPVRANRQDGWF